MRGDGAGLLRDLDKFEQVVATVVNATKLPVTVKTRLGWDDDSICILDVARMVEQCGVQALSVHCRTRCQGYRGQADWSWLPKIKAVCGLPVIGNGDVKTPEDVKTLFNLGCDGVMIGRGAITNPWIFQDAKEYLAKGRYRAERTLDERVDLCLRHLKDRADYCGERRAVLEHRKHYANYLKGYRNAARLRASLMEFETIAPVEARLRDYCEVYRDDRDEADSQQ